LFRSLQSLFNHKSQTFGVFLTDEHRSSICKCA